MPYAARQAYRNSVLQDLSEQYPREFIPAQQIIESARWYTPERLPEVQKRYRVVAAEHPEDQLAQTILAASLISRNTPVAIAILEKLADVPDYPWPALLLAQVYERGKRIDQAKASANLERYLQQCPATVDREAQAVLGSWAARNNRPA